jgi:hypothetical protein
MPPAPKSPRTILLTSLLKHSPQAMDGSGTASWSSFANPTDSSTLRTLLLTMERSLKTGATSEVANFLAPDGKTLLWAPLTEGTRQILGSHLVDHELEAAWRAAGGSHGEAIDGGPSLSRGPLANSRHEIVVLAVNRTRTGSDRRLFGDLWNAMAESYLEALRTAKNGQELSLVPVFKSGKPVAAVVFSVRDASPLLRPHPANDLVRGDVLAPNPLQRIVVEATARVVPSPKDGELQATLELSRWLNHEGQATTFSALLSPIYSPNRSTRLAFDLAQIKVPEASLVRVGALDLEPGELPPLPDGGDTTNREQRRVGLLIADYRPPLQTTVAQDKVVEVLVQLQLPLRRAQPGGQDDGPAAVPASLLEAAPPFIEPRRRGERPLVILRPGESGATEPLVLEGRESSDRSRREMTLQLRRLRRHSVEAQPERAMIIDRTPFLVAEVELNALGTDEKALDLPELGNWSLGGENGSGWELLSQDFTLRLPPQGLGEQLERRSGEGIEVGERSELRFSPPAALVLGAAPFEQRFAEAQWNLRRLLERPGQRLPGAPIRKLTFELLYGLSTTVEASGLMLSELFSRFGVPAEQVEGLLLAWPATQAQKDAFKGFGHAWTKRLQELASRLAVLEPWSVREPDAPLRLTEGVRGQLRAEADLRYPILGAEPPPGSSIPNHPDGLAGGVAWGFESANVYEATWRDPRSVSAVVERPMFSALGGWGFQKTVFDEGRQAIYSDVAMGRTFYYALERIGRVGVLWNRAKHVIGQWRRACNLPASSPGTSAGRSCARCGSSSNSSSPEGLSRARVETRSRPGPCSAPSSRLSASRWTRRGVVTSASWAGRYRCGGRGKTRAPTRNRASASPSRPPRIRAPRSSRSRSTSRRSWSSLRTPGPARAPTATSGKRSRGSTSSTCPCLGPLTRRWPTASSEDVAVRWSATRARRPRSRPLRSRNLAMAASSAPARHNPSKPGCATSPSSVAIPCRRSRAAQVLASKRS